MFNVIVMSKAEHPLRVKIILPILVILSSTIYFLVNIFFFYLNRVVKIDLGPTNDISALFSKIMGYGFFFFPLKTQVFKNQLLDADLEILRRFCENKLVF